MREIKFRGYDGMDWVYGTAVDYEKETDTYYMFIDDAWAMVGRVGQYTGMKDKNGVEIFEGDIVKYDDWKPKEVHYEGGYGFMGFRLKNTELFLMGYDSRNYEVIGNIYEQSIYWELINSKEESK